MKTAIIASSKDAASMNIRSHLLKMFSFGQIQRKTYGQVQSSGDVSLHTIEQHTISFENPQDFIETDRFIFVSKHAANSGIPTLSVHAPGNFSAADLGGKASLLCPSLPLMMKQVLRLLDEKHHPGFDVVQEVTHHGPEVLKPVMFIEVGSTENEWKDPLPAKVQAEVVQELLTNPIPDAKPAVGVGGPHTMPNFKKIMLDSEYAIGHAFPKHALEFFTTQMLKQALEKTATECNTVIADWKGLGKYKQQVKDVCEKLGANLLKTKDF